MVCNSDAFYYHLVMASQDEFNLVDSEPIRSMKLEHLNNAMEYINQAKLEIEKKTGIPYTGFNDLYRKYSNKFFELCEKPLDNILEI